MGNLCDLLRSGWQPVLHQPAPQRLLLEEVKPVKSQVSNPAGLDDTLRGHGSSYVS
jgi:hypothetical protein